MNAILFQPTGEVRPVKHGELSMGIDGEIWVWPCELPSADHRSIFTRHEIPAEVAQRMMEEAKP